tara:strand:- start:10961 stop:11551 length:591 start_codon:yes stop_codon:yes gene_type:complete
MSAVSNSEIAIQIANGNEGVTVESLYRQHSAEIRQYIAKTFGSGPPDPEDVAQATFAKVAAVNDLSELRNPRAFLYRVAHNIAVSNYRRNSTQKKYVDSLDSADDTQVSDDLHPERVTLARERLALLDAAYRELPVLQQELMVMHRLHNLSYAEIARRKSMSQTEVKRQVASAVAGCQEYLDRAFETRCGHEDGNQ